MIRRPKDITDCRRFFGEPSSPRQRQYEALRAFYVEGAPSAEAAKRFGYAPGAFRVLCHAFRRDELPEFFGAGKPGPITQPKKSAALEKVVALRKRNYSIYEISKELKEHGTPLSPTAVGELLAAEGFARLPRRRDDERPDRVGPTVEAIADVRNFSLSPREFTTRVGGLFLFIPDLVRLDAEVLAANAKLAHDPGRACAARVTGAQAVVDRAQEHVMALVADEGLGLFCGLNAMPKRSFLSEYSSRISPQKVSQLLAGWHAQLSGETIVKGESLNLDFHSVPYFGEHPLVQSHYLSKRSRRQPSILTFLAQDADSEVFCYSNADIRKGEEPEEIFRFIKFWTRQHGSPPKHLVFDSKLTTFEGLDRLDEEGITFITLRRRSPALLKEIADLPPSAWRTVNLDVPHRKYRTPRVYEQKARPRERTFRQFFIKDLGHDEPTIALTNDNRATAGQVITRYAKRMLIENALSDAVHFFHIDALSSSVGMKVDFDMALLVLASGLYRLMANRMRGYHDAQARQIFRDLIDMSADVVVTQREVTVRFHRRAHLPVVLDSELFKTSTPVPWWDGLPLRFIE